MIKYGRYYRIGVVCVRKILSVTLAIILLVATLFAAVPMEAAQAATAFTFPLPTANAPYYVTVLNKYSNGTEHSSYINEWVLGGSSAPNNIVVDIAASKNTPVYAVAAGTVTINKYTSGSGNHVVIKHSDGSYSYYGHLIELSSAAKGTTVTAGQQIGKVGMTGSATGYHIHFEWSKHDPYCLFANAGLVKILSDSGASKYPHVHTDGGDSGSSDPCTCSTKYAGTYKVKGTDGTLSISSGHGASTAAGNSKLGSIPEGASVSISMAEGYNGQGASSGLYGHVTYNGISGYCSMNYLEKVSSTTSCSCSTSYAGWYTVSASSGLAISSGHGASTATGNTELGVIPNGTKVYISKAQAYNGLNNTSGKYGHVTYNGISGYCSMNRLDLIDSYTLTLNANGGSVSKSSFKVWAGIKDNYDLSNYLPTRSGYIFQGWYTAASGGTQVYNANGVCTNEGSYWKNNTYVRGANATLYAHWIADTVFASSITLSEGAVVMTEGDTLTLSATVLPSNTTNKSVQWTSSDESVLTVNDGVCTAVGYGTAQVIASTTDGSALFDTCDFTVCPNVDMIEVFPESMVLAADGLGSDNWILALTSPAGYMDDVVWSSSDESIVTAVNGIAFSGADIGIVTAVSAGTAEVTASIPYGPSVTCTVTVTADMPLMTLPADLTKIEAEAFAGVDASRIEIPDGCTSIGSRAFADCADLRYISIPDSVTEIAEDAFQNCNEYMMIYCSENSAAYNHAYDYGFRITLPE